MNGNLGIRPLERRDFYDVLKDFPPLPEDAIIGEPYSADYPIAVDTKTGMHYSLREGQWVPADK